MTTSANEPVSWHTEPLEAFETWLVSNEFGQTRRLDTQYADYHRLSANSVEVYVSMFQKFLRHLNGLKQPVVDARESDIEGFFNQVLARSSAETRSRYARLTERVYEHLLRSGSIAVNPVSTWMRSNGGTRSRVFNSPTPDACLVTVPTIERLQHWLHDRGASAMRGGDWRAARNLTLASLSLGTGMRHAELLRLQRSQVFIRDHHSASGRFEFKIPTTASTRSVLEHRTPVGHDCVQLFEAWWDIRWNGFRFEDKRGGEILRVPAGEFLFPSTLTGKMLTPSPLYRNLGKLAAYCVDQGVLDDSSRWVLDRGAEGLRRAFVLSSLAVGVDPDLLTERLGHHRRASVRRVERKARQEAARQSTLD